MLRARASHIVLLRPIRIAKGVLQGLPVKMEALKNPAQGERIQCRSDADHGRAFPNSRAVRELISFAA
jgi:hypothetical protein